MVKRLDTNDLESVSFWGFNTEIFKEVLNKEQNKITDNMSDTEKKSYLLGVENTLSLLKQTFDAGTDDSSLFFYHPDVESVTEFDVYDLQDWMKGL